MKTSFQIKIGGCAGEGIKISGLILGRALTRLGYSIFAYNEYPSLIRGGHNAYQIHASVDKVFSQVKKIDILIALNQETIKLHQSELSSDSLTLYDPGEFKLPKGHGPEYAEGKLIGQYIPIKLIELAKKCGGKPIMANMVSLGAALAFLNLPLTTLKEVIAKTFAGKPKEITDLNQKATEEGKKFIKDNNLTSRHAIASPDLRLKSKRMVLTGNEAISLGAIAGGLQFFSAYPMTPATSILHYLAGKSKQTGILVKHVEDEVSAINMAVGAGFTGVRSMTATSGGGLCLMAEGISLAGISETPVVIVNAMRPGPGLGMPTWTAQGDLQFVLHIGHDEFPRVVFAPGDAQEAFYLTKTALVLAEKYQLPVFILTDKYLSESDFSPELFASIHQNQRFGFLSKIKNKLNNPFKRYQFTKNGVSSRSLPGQAGGIHGCNSYEHDELGYTTEESNNRSMMMDKRMKKLALIKSEMPEQPIFGDDKAKTSLISWGSNKGPILETLKTLNAKDAKTERERREIKSRNLSAGRQETLNYLHLNCLWPFPKEQVKKFIQSAEKTICLECNSTGQLASLIKEQTGLEVEKLLKYNGRPFFPEEIIEELT